MGLAFARTLREANTAMAEENIENFIMKTKG
jgi:hypothetical protein